MHSALKTALCKERKQSEAIYIAKLEFWWSPELFQILEQQQTLSWTQSFTRSIWKACLRTLLNSSFTFLRCLCNEVLNNNPVQLVFFYESCVWKLHLTFKIESLGSFKQESPSKYSNTPATQHKSVGRHTMIWNLLTLNSTNALLR